VADFLEQLKKRQEAVEKPSEATEQEQAKTTDQMTDAELEEAITTTRRQLLDAQHAELREREIARVSGSSGTDPEPSLADVLRQKQRGKRRTWR
jgi:glutamyl-tRNA reductase